MRRGQQRKIRAPAVSPQKCQEFVATDWRDGHRMRIRAAQRNAESFCRLAEQGLTRSARRKRRGMRGVDQFRIHTPDGSKRVAALLKRYGRRLTFRYVPKYSPDCMPMEWFWNDWRDHVTHNHERQDIAEREADSDNYFADCTCHPEKVLQTIGSPFAK